MNKDDSAASSIAEEPLSLSILSSIAEEPLALSLSTDDKEFEGGVTRIPELEDGIFEPLFSSTPGKRRRVSYEDGCLDSSRTEEPLLPGSSVSIQEQETSCGEESGDDDGAKTLVDNQSEGEINERKTNDRAEGNISISKLFNERTFFFMFEDGSSQCRNRVVDLGGKVEDFFDVVKVTDLVVKRKKGGPLPLAKFTDTYSRGQRALNCSSRGYSPRFTAKIVDIALKNKISVHTKEEFDQLVISRKPHRNKTPMMQDRKREKVKKLKPPFIKVEDRSRKFCPIFKEFVKWPTFDVEEDHGRVPEQFVVEKMKKRIYCEHCEEYVFESQLEMHCDGKRHKSITREEGYWSRVDALISKLPSPEEFETNCREKKLLSAESEKSTVPT